MQVITPLKALAQSTETTLLKRNIKAPGLVRALQMLLYGLGYGAALNWKSYRADGGYGGSTTAALAAFLKDNKLQGDGSSLNKATLDLLLSRYEALPLLREVDKANKTDQLNDLFAGPSGTGKVQQLQKVSGITFAGAIPSKAEIDQLLAKLATLSGKDWLTAPYQDDPGGTPDIITQSSRYTVADNWVRVRLNRKSKGVWTIGNDTPLAFIQRSSEALKSIGLSDSSIRVITPVSGNEGNLNAINSYDNSFMTFGMFQWTLGQGGNKGELPALLLKLKEVEPTVFHNYFGQYGVDLVSTNKTTGYLSLNGQKINTPAEKEKFRKGPLWAFRFWAAGLDDRVKKVQVQHALDRINSFWTNDNYRPLNKFYISDLVTSEYGMCLLLDHHVNRPGHLMSYAIGKKDIVGQALKKAGLQDSKPHNWGTAEEQKLIAAYLPLRYASSMTHAKARALKIKNYLDKGLLSAERFSFQPTPIVAAERSLDGAPVLEEYPLIDFKEYESKERLTPGE